MAAPSPERFCGCSHIAGEMVASEIFALEYVRSPTLSRRARSQVLTAGPEGALGCSTTASLHHNVTDEPILPSRRTFDILHLDARAPSCFHAPIDACVNGFHLGA
jgi:hypothetical protein